MLYDAGVSRRITLTVLAAIWSLVIVDSIFVMPKFKISIIEDIPDKTSDYKGDKSKKNKDEEKCRDNLAFENTESQANGLTHHQVESQTSNQIENRAQSVPTQVCACDPIKKAPPPKITLWQCVFSLYYLIHLGWFCALYLRAQTFYGSFNAWVSWIDKDKGGDKVYFYILNSMQYRYLVFQ